MHAQIRGQGKSILQMVVVGGMLNLSSNDCLLTKGSGLGKTERLGRV